MGAMGKRVPAGRAVLVMTYDEAGKVLSVGRYTVRAWIEKGYLVRVSTGGRAYVTVASVGHLMRVRRGKA